MAVFLKMDSAKGCQVIRETKMRNGGTVSLVVLNLYAGTEIGVATFDAKRSVADSQWLLLSRSFLVL